ncbi:MAG: type II toxin-antitoxin system VapB family antitoxin [bacterium]
MRTTLNIDDALLNTLIEITKEKSKTKAISIAIKDYIKNKKLEKILSYQGNLKIENNWEQLEQEELKENEHEK